MKASDTLKHQAKVWPVPYTCAQPYHPRSGSHRLLSHPQFKYEFFIYTSYNFTPDGTHELNKLTSLSMCGFIAQLVEHRTGIAEVTSSNPVEALIFSGFFFPIVQIGKFTAMNILHLVSALLRPISMTYPSGRNRTKSPM